MEFFSSGKKEVNERYSRGAHSEAEAQVQGYSNQYSEAITRSTHVGDMLSNKQIQEILDNILERREKAKKRLEMQEEKGQVEAIVLNQEYDDLLSKLQEVMNEVKNFEKNKLGIKEEK